MAAKNIIQKYITNTATGKHKYLLNNKYLLHK